MAPTKKSKFLSSSPHAAASRPEAMKTRKAMDADENTRGRPLRRIQDLKAPSSAEVLPTNHAS
jgi:hypothetical protein